MEPSARSLLLELMAKSKKGLSFAEQLCSQAREELDACQGHSDGIEKMYSKLCFVSRQIRAQITTVEVLLRIARTRLHDISLASKSRYPADARGTRCYVTAALSSRKVLDSDTALMLVIIEELEESLALVQATSEEVSVREHLYATAYQEAVAFFKKIDALEPDLVKLFEAFKSCEGIEEEFDATEKVIEEINSLAIWYEEFHNSYGALTLEVVRRHQVHQTQQRLIQDFVEKMEATYSDEMHHRAVFSEKHGKFLPMDLCPTFADPPLQHEVLTHGEWRLPMPTRETLQLVEGNLRAMEDLP
ncbi:autophagy protein 17 [Mortierella alpina]|nr:autophagy protein 17 [Mortierella alpina]